ncbi:MAG: 5-(carboxyamino)imidazole ribonucleotide mutase [Deltaproteobacteria bacterium]|nr:5-(carboxyamino)imidazole ribonucleotide mutase [Deltaproteobacteria bacterium]
MSAQVLLLMGSKNDWKVVKKARDVLEELGVEAEAHVSSAHRSPARTLELIAAAEAGGAKVIICAAGLAAHLAGVTAAHTLLPVVAIPIGGGSLGGLDALLSTVQMPPGIPVATVGIDRGKNAGLLAAQIIALSDEGLRGRLQAFRKAQTEAVAGDDGELV